MPDTNKTRYYDFTVSRGSIAPDGYEKDVILINGQFPGVGRERLRLTDFVVDLFLIANHRGQLGRLD
jgi:hypothetical protein